MVGAGALLTGAKLNLQVSIYPLRIYLTETMYRKLWEYLFPGDEQDVKRQV